MGFDLSDLQPKERASFALRALYEAAGCRKYHMGRFEEYGLYQEHRSFLSSEQVITFTDLDGRLLALKPDVTLSIAKTAQPAPGETLKYYYHENVYRPSAESHTFKEIAQMGLEMLGAVGEAQVQQAVGLAAKSLEQLGAAWVLELSHMGYLFGLLDALAVPETARPALLDLLREKNAHELRAAAKAAGLDDAGADTLCALLTLCGGCEETLARAEAFCKNDRMRAAAAELRALTRSLSAVGGSVRLDLSLAGEMEYYNGLVFQGYLQGLPRPLLKGGRYDLLMQKFTPGADAIGFAVYLDELDRLSAPLPPVQQQKTDRVMLNVALPKGRLGDKVYGLLARIGYGCAEDYNATRKLVVENPEAGSRYFLVTPSDVAFYVELGAADVGIVGKDILTEASADVYELLDTGLGRCRMCVAAPADYKDDPSRPVRVASKFVNIAKSDYAFMGRDIDSIMLNGSFELATFLGLSDVIVDIVATGPTLRETGLLWDEGPDIGGPVGPYVQSERMGMFKQYAEQLVAEGKAYYCFCTEERLEALHAEQRANGEMTHYDGCCRDLPKEEGEKRLAAGEPYGIRQKIPREGVTGFDDVVYGHIEVNNSEMDDQILIKTDGMPTYNFANVVDDHLMGITHVIRGSEYLSSTPKYNLLYQAFGWEIPTYIHCPPVMKDAQNKLSKRNGDASYQDLRAKGYLSAAILNYICLLGWSPRGEYAEQEIFSLDELRKVWSPDGISKSPAIFDPLKLRAINAEYIRRLSPEEFQKKAEPWIDKAVHTSIDKKLQCANLQPRCEVLGELPEQLDFFDAMPEYDVSMYANKKQKTTPESAKEALEALLPVLSDEALDFNDRDTVFDACKAKAEELGKKHGWLLYPLGIALSGKQRTPGGGTDLACMMGRETTLARVKAAIEKLNG